MRWAHGLNVECTQLQKWAVAGIGLGGCAISFITPKEKSPYKYAAATAIMLTGAWMGIKGWKVLIRSNSPKSLPLRQLNKQIQPTV